jgi:hypothetical protein
MISGVIVLVGPFINNQSPYKNQHPTGMVEASTLTFVICQWESAYEELRMRGLWVDSVVRTWNIDPSDKPYVCSLSCECVNVVSRSSDHLVQHIQSDTTSLDIQGTRLARALPCCAAIS